MDFKEAQDMIQKFDEERGWPKGTTHLKDFLLNMTEEVGEVWNIIKWVDEETQKKLIQEHKDKFSDFVGDQLWLILKIAYHMDIDSEKAFKETVEEYEQRMPADKIRQFKHTNKFAGGFDDKSLVTKKIN